MNITTENILLVGSILLFISVLAGKTSYRFGVPVLIFFLAIGMLAGSEGIGGIYFDNPKTAQFVGIIALNFILFSGGFETDLKAIKPVLRKGIVLSTLGVLITAITVGLFVWYFLGFTIYEGLLLGSIVSSTDSAAVFSILRSKSLALKHNIRPLLELESGSNDPMAYVLTIVFTGLVMNPEMTLLSSIPMFIQQLVLGTAMGLGLGFFSKQIINKIKLDYEGLYTVLAIALMFFVFAATDYIGGNGFLAVYLSAVYLGNQELIHKKKILKTFDGFAWLMQIVLFVTLGLLVFPSRVVPVLGTGLIISAVLILFARPVSVFITMIPFRMSTRIKLFISWVGLRGAVPIVFATYPLIAGVDKAGLFFNIVFFISISSVLVQGTTLHVVGKWLHLILPESVKPRTLFDMERFESIKSHLHEILIPSNSSVVGKEIVEIGFPKTALISFIRRNGKFITPSGSTVIEANDKLFVLAENDDSMKDVFDCLDVEED
ncbi:MAG: potassium/proton antiporter [Candidatus Kapaibacterium sp.]